MVAAVLISMPRCEPGYTDKYQYSRHVWATVWAEVYSQVPVVDMYEINEKINHCLLANYNLAFFICIFKIDPLIISFIIIMI